MNKTLIRRVVAVSLFLAVLIVPRGFAQVARVFLSGTGTDSGDCSNAAAPCRSLQYAINQAAAGAEVVILSSGGFGGATITKSITVNAPTGVIAFVGRTITVTIASTDTVTLRGLSMNGAVFADSFGINFTTGGTLNVENTVISSFTVDGINDTADSSRMWVSNCDLKKNATGINVSGTNGAAVIENTRVVDSSFDGIVAGNSANVAVHHSVSEGAGTGAGFNAYSIGGATELVVDSCVSTKNTYGLRTSQSGIGNTATLRAGENVVMNNGTNLSTNGGTLLTQGGNRVGGVSGGTTGFNGSQPQQ